MKKATELLEKWNEISSIPPYRWVQMYSAEYERGPGKERQGIMIGHYKPESTHSPAEFCDDTGIVVNWNFTHWKPLVKPAI